MSAAIERLRAPVGDADRDALLALEAAAEPHPLGWAALGAEAARADGCLLGLRGDDATLVGFASGRLLAGTAHVLRLTVDPMLRRRGHGRALLDALVAWAAAEGADEVTLEVRAGNAAAVALYAGAGFAVVGRRPRYYADGEDAVLMTRPRPRAVA
jgi:ribosomal-protein-alanine acetyltransferase